MLSTGQDIRITKTHMALSKTLMDLLEKKSFQKITVNDICQDAMVSRSTFYMHFEDKYQLMLFCLQKERQRFDEAAQSMAPRDMLHAILSSVCERKKIFYNFFKAEIDMEFFNMFKNFFYDFISENLTKLEQKEVKLPGPIPPLVAYYANGLAGMTIWWIENDFSLPIDEMVICQYNLLSDILPKDSK